MDICAQHTLPETKRSDSPEGATHAPISMVEIILKAAERCNLACTYCYYFFSADQSWKSRPGRVARSVLDQLAKFLAEGAAAIGLPAIKIVFHGGEPLRCSFSDKAPRRPGGEVKNVGTETANRPLPL